MPKIGLVVQDDNGSMHTVQMHDLDKLLAAHAQFGQGGGAQPVAFFGLDLAAIAIAAKCHGACVDRAGYGGCVATCIASGGTKACDGGVSDCKDI